MEDKIKIQLWLEMSSWAIREDEDPYLEGPTFETSKAILARDCREQALKTWTREQITLGGLTYDDLTNKVYSCPVHDDVFPEDNAYNMMRSDFNF